MGASVLSGEGTEAGGYPAGVGLYAEGSNQWFGFFNLLHLLPYPGKSLFRIRTPPGVTLRHHHPVAVIPFYDIEIIPEFKTLHNLRQRNRRTGR